MPNYKALTFILAAAVFFLLAPADEIRANGSPPYAITGQISSQKEGPMEGVVIGAKKDGSTITVNVVSDEKGRFHVPAAKLEPGRYTLKIRAAGYDLDSPKTVDIVAGKATTANVKLKPTENLSAQLSDAEWLLSIPVRTSRRIFSWAATAVTRSSAS